MLIVELVGLRAFSDVWFWALFAALWAMMTGGALGVPDAEIAAARASPAGAAALAERLASRQARPVPPVRGALLRRLVRAGLGSAAGAALAVWALVFGIELAQALVLLALPPAIAALLARGTRAQLAALAAAGRGPVPTGQAAAEVLRAHRARLRRLGAMSLLAGLLAVQAGYLPFAPLWGH